MRGALHGAGPDLDPEFGPSGIDRYAVISEAPRRVFSMWFSQASPQSLRGPRIRGNARRRRQYHRSRQIVRCAPTARGSSRSPAWPARVNDELLLADARRSRARPGGDAFKTGQVVDIRDKPARPTRGLAGLSSQTVSETPWETSRFPEWWHRAPKSSARPRSALSRAKLNVSRPLLWHRERIRQE